ncbi:MAG TPA: outer membrane protein [Methylovirgula sp.]|nr:outer membrane protein [Methylovirgula sp.]
MLRRFLITTALVSLAGGSALAADLPNQKGPPVFTPPPPPPPAFTWSGVYIGGQVGYQWSAHSQSPNVFDPTGAFVTSLPGSSPRGIVGGGHVGYNFQVAQFVFGLEGDVDGSSYSGGNGSGIIGYTDREPVEASIRGRVGYAWDRLLIYGTGGVAFGDFHDTYFSPLGVDSIWHEHTGWTAGAGLEYAITNNWSLRGEYRYSDFGHISDPLTASFAPGATATRHETDHRVQVGFSYKFDLFEPPAPVVSKY